MNSPTDILADFSSGLAYEDIPEPALDMAKAAIIDAVAVGLFGSELPWSRIAQTVASDRTSARSPLLDRSFTRVSARNAALINGTFIHAFEFDSLRYPNAGVHAGSTIWPAVLSVGSELASPGSEALAAFVAGCEVAFRIGLAGKGAFEKLGFHAPGVTGVFGAAAAAGRLLHLDPDRMANAFGIAGSMCGGLLAFSKAGSGGAVKPLHMGRAAEAGVFAAQLAAEGYQGPRHILEGQFGVLDAYARGGTTPALIKNLGLAWETQNICIKKYPCHVMAQTVVEAIRDVVAKKGVHPADIAGLSLGVNEKILSHHAERSPSDVGTSQYSVPMCAAIALFRDASQPAAFLTPHGDPAIRDWASRIELLHLDEDGMPGFEWAVRLQITTKSGRIIQSLKKTFEGMEPSKAPELATRKFEALTGTIDESTDLLRRLHSLEAVEDLSRLLSLAAKRS
ncbi:MmgE/PrpD family protein [Pseudochelatococcus sp. B33]